jgi:hypothetical protein
VAETAALVAVLLDFRKAARISAVMTPAIIRTRIEAMNVAMDCSSLDLTTDESETG